MEIGIDIEQNERFKNVTQKFIERAFTKNEIAYAEKFVNKHEQYCSLWCVKEATVKAFSNLAICFQDIEVKATPEGRPYIEKNEIISLKYLLFFSSVSVYEGFAAFFELFAFAAFTEGLIFIKDKLKIIVTIVINMEKVLNILNFIYPPPNKLKLLN